MHARHNIWATVQSLQRQAAIFPTGQQPQIGLVDRTSCESSNYLLSIQIIAIIIITFTIVTIVFISPFSVLFFQNKSGMIKEHSM